MKKTIQILLILIAFSFSLTAQNVDLKRGLVAYYPFNGNANDESGNSNNGKVTGAVLTSDRNGKLNSAYYFDGLSFIDCGSSSFNFGNSDFSICLWVNSSTLSTSQSLVSKEKSGSQEQQFRLIYIKNSIYFCMNGSGFWNGDYTLQKSINSQAWSFICIVKSGNEYSLHIDGARVRSISASVSYFANNNNLLIGARYGNSTQYSDYFKGMIDEVRMYNRTLSELEIQALYNYQEKSVESPIITFNNPNSTYQTVNQPTFNLNACIKSSEPLKNYAIYVNGNISRGYNIVPSSSCDFKIETTINLQEGNNSVKIVAENSGGTTTSSTYTINYVRTVVNNTNVVTTDIQTGKYYALIVGNNAYQDAAISTLNEPVNDAAKLYNVLTTYYTFEPQNVTFLKNASYVQIIEAFDNLSNKITPNDNLLVFYAGHGWWDETKNLGYWLPVDAKKSSTAFWIPNSRISDYMSSINSKHTLLIADACFSGSIFKTRSAFSDAQPAINKLYELPSKKAMTSGNLKEVPDKSVFLQYLVKRLEENKEKYISSDMLFASFRQAVLNNSPTEPQYGTIQNAGDEGGEFIFIRRIK